LNVNDVLFPHRLLHVSAVGGGRGEFDFGTDLGDPRETLPMTVENMTFMLDRTLHLAAMAVAGRGSTIFRSQVC
jgi:hypothetical protein